MQNRPGAVPKAALVGDRGFTRFSFVVALLLLTSLTFLVATKTTRVFAEPADHENVTTSRHSLNPTGAQAGVPALLGHTARTSPLDLEVGGDLAGLPANSTRYITREELLALPQVSFTVTGDANFAGPTQISGVSLEELARQLSTSPSSELIVALCGDQYRGNFPPTYTAAHHPVLVLKIGGQPPSGWPKAAEGQNLDMSPYLISHPNFTPSFKILAHDDEQQNPWGVVRIEFRDEATVFGAVAPRGPEAHDPQVQAGYGIARQNCFRCHNMGAEGGTKAGRPWPVLSAWATAQPNYFASYIHNPRSKNPNAQMPSFPAYDDATIRALIAYFQTFTAGEKP
jgi:mono/diheme cytochrome c family protein